VLRSAAIILISKLHKGMVCIHCLELEININKTNVHLFTTWEQHFRDKVDESCHPKLVPIGYKSR
jgi:hypothetical protein